MSRSSHPGRVVSASGSAESDRHGSLYRVRRQAGAALSLQYTLYGEQRTAPGSAPTRDARRPAAVAGRPAGHSPDPRGAPTAARVVPVIVSIRPVGETKSRARRIVTAAGGFRRPPSQPTSKSRAQSWVL